MASGLSIACPICNAQPWQRCVKDGWLPHKERTQSEHQVRLSETVVSVKQMVTETIVKPTPVSQPISSIPIKSTTHLQHQVYFTYNKSTIGAHQFKECDKQGNPVPLLQCIIGTLYVRKSLMGVVAPDRINVSVDYEARKE